MGVGADGRYDEVTRKIEIAHERWMKEQDLKLARIDSKKAIEIAKQEVEKTKVADENYQIVRVVVRACILIAFIAACCTYCGTQPPNTQDDEIKQQKYEVCMAVEKSDKECD